jgi:hypothetical protein
MHRTVAVLLLLLSTVAHGSVVMRGQPAPAGPGKPGAQPTLADTLGPPGGGGPTLLRARFDLHDINGIDDENETFEFTGVMTLTWHDPRQAFDAAAAGVRERVFQGAYQFDEISPGWYPQVVMINECGLYQKSGVVLRVAHDGTCTQIETINACAKVTLDMRRFPFDRHILRAKFEVLGFDADRVRFEAPPGSIGLDAGLNVPQWSISGATLGVAEHAAAYAGGRGVSSLLTLAVEVRRESFYITRLVVLPLIIIVLLSFSVFWMDRSSLGDRISVSFIGILTCVAYQIVMSDNLPRIAYVTLMHGFLNLSFLSMCLTVVINLLVGAMEKRGRAGAGVAIDRACRWAFPAAYFGLMAVMTLVAFRLPDPMA